MFLVLMLISFMRMELEALFALLAKEPFNSGRIRLSLVRFRSSGHPSIHSSLLLLFSPGGC